MGRVVITSDLSSNSSFDEKKRINLRSKFDIIERKGGKHDYARVCEWVHYKGDAHFRPTSLALPSTFVCTDL